MMLTANDAYVLRMIWSCCSWNLLVISMLCDEIQTQRLFWISQWQVEGWILREFSEFWEEKIPFFLFYSFLNEDLSLIRIETPSLHQYLIFSCFQLPKSMTPKMKCKPKDCFGYHCDGLKDGSWQNFLNSGRKRTTSF